MSILAGLISRFAGVAFKSTLGGGTAPLLIVAGFAGALALSYGKGVEHQSTRCQTTELRAVVEAQTAALERLQSQLTLARQTRLAASQRRLVDGEAYNQMKVEADAYKREIANDPDRCVLSPDGADRLRRIGR